MLISGLLYLLGSNALTMRRDKSILFSRITIEISIFSLLLATSVLFMKSLGLGIGLFGGLFHSTPITQTFHIFILLISGIILQLTSFYPRKIWSKSLSSLYFLILKKFIYYNTKIVNKMAEQYKIIEYPLILLFIVLGAVFLVSTSDLVSIFLSIELQSYGLYLLSSIYRNSELATTGGLTYFLLGGLSSCFILLGTGLLYANSGTTNLDGLYIITSISDAANIVIEKIRLSLSSWYEPSYINLSLVIMCVGFLFKVSAAPFHFWSPDVYDAIPTIVTTFVAIIAKISIFIFFLELVHYTSNILFSFNFTWTTIFLVSSLLSLIIGTVVGLTQFRIKRLLAFSTISHLGFILLALSINTIESIQAFLFYLVQYSLSNLNAFIILIAMGYSLFSYTNKNKEFTTLKEKNNSPIQLITQMKGYFYMNPVLALSLCITLFSFVGIPPLIGFFAKQMVLSAALEDGYIFLALVAILTSVIGAVYYLGIIKQVFFDEPEHQLNPEMNNMIIYGKIEARETNNTDYEKESINLGLENIKLASYFSISISIITLIISLFIFVPQEWLSMANILSLLLFNC
jgi:NADH-ubiquinone oxidoreductase chain 2